MRIPLLVSLILALAFPSPVLARVCSTSDTDPRTIESTWDNGFVSLRFCPDGPTRECEELGRFSRAALRKRRFTLVQNAGHFVLGKVGMGSLIVSGGVAFAVVVGTAALSAGTAAAVAATTGKIASKLPEQAGPAATAAAAAVSAAPMALLVLPLALGLPIAASAALVLHDRLETRTLQEWSADESGQHGPSDYLAEANAIAESNLNSKGCVKVVDFSAYHAQLRAALAPL